MLKVALNTISETIIIYRLFLLLQFQLILNVAVGGGFFPDSFHNDRNRPWNNDDHQYKNFWERRNEWLLTWHGENAAMAIDYVEMIQT